MGFQENIPHNESQMKNQNETICSANKFVCTQDWQGEAKMGVDEGQQVCVAERFNTHSYRKWLDNMYSM